ncbi:hypothetical protein A4S02_07880 [Acetobacter ascendens]|uniref:Uncharacterized protein n=1 Tax=Acetobacter ascendens TaxID=481146 RepID=A0A1D8QWN6_9PROT|nr:hypothetical protein [Acetobacter ascendens]AOW46704.1 hypothetical protein A4S02_07880 [Acetobacter ascendens]
MQQEQHHLKNMPMPMRPTDPHNGTARASMGGDDAFKILKLLFAQPCRAITWMGRLADFTRYAQMQTANQAVR